MYYFKSSFKLWCLNLGFILLFAISLPLTAIAGDEVNELRQEVKTLQEKIEKLEKKSSWNEEDIGDLSKRVDKTEMHTVSDKVALDIDFRTKAESIHYNDNAQCPGTACQRFFYPRIHGRF